MFKQWNVCLAILVLFFCSLAKADFNSDYKKFEVYVDQNGNYILRVPPTFVLIAADINIPLNITPKNGVFKLIQNGLAWSLVPITQGEFESLTLTAASNITLEFHDVDGDGVNDLILRDVSGNRDSFIVSNLTGIANVDAYSISRNGIDLSQGSALTLKDVNGDGITDIINGDASGDPMTYLGSRSGQLIDTSALDLFTNPGNVVGLSAGEFKVTESGAATYNIPFILPQGISGVVPQIGLTYNSQSGDGVLGVGWNISGLSVISRCPKNIVTDGFIAGVKFNDSDALCLNGQRLILNKNSSDEYHTEVDSFSIIKRYDGNHGPSYFSVTNKANEVYYYGGAPNNISMSEDAYVTRTGKKYTSDSEAASWVLKAIVDNKGNYIRYDYNRNQDNGSHTIKNIAYGGNVNTNEIPINQIYFDYVDIQNPKKGLSHGGPITQDKQLIKIVIYQDDDVFRTYKINWSRTSIPEEKDNITAIQECFDISSTSCLPATYFKVEQPEKKSSIATSYQPFEIGKVNFSRSSTNRDYAQVADFNGDGIADILLPSSHGWEIYSSYSTTQSVNINDYNGKWEKGFLSQNSIGRSIKDRSVNHKYQTITDSKVGEKEYVKIIDANGDGINDLLIPVSGVWHIITLDTSSNYVYKSLNISSSAYENTTIADVDGDGMHDILFSEGDKLYYYKNLGSSFSSKKMIDISYGSLENYGGDVRLGNSRFLDANGDGITDIIMEVKSIQFGLPRRSTNLYIATLSAGRLTYTISSHIYWGTSATSFTGSPVKILQTVDFNGDGLPDIVKASTVKSSNDFSWNVYFSRGDDLLGGNIPLDFLNIKDAQIAYRNKFIDLNGDGITDILAATNTNKYDIYITVPDKEKIVRFEKRGSIEIGTSRDATVRLADINGDGKVDLLSASSDSGYWQLQEASRSYIKDQVITQITNGFGVKTDIAYATLSSGIPLLNVKSSQKPVGTDYISLFSGISVVTEVATQSSNTDSVLIQYGYGGALAHKKGRGLSGFETVQTTDPQSGVVTTTQYYQLYPLTGLAQSTTRKYKDKLLSNTFNTYTQTTSANGGMHVYLNTSKETSYGLDLSTDGTTVTNHKIISETLTTNLHDNWDNLFSSLIQVKDATGSLVHETRISNHYDNAAYNTINPDALVLARPHTQVTSQSGSQPDARQFGRLYKTIVSKSRFQNTESGSTNNQSRETKFSYYPNGMLRESNVDGLTTSFFYDIYGNKVAEQSYGKHDSNSYQKRGQYWFYDSRGQYLSGQMNQNGESEMYLYNGQSSASATLGRIYSQTTTGPNKLATTSYFDIQGQVIRQIYADGNNSETSRSICTSCDHNFITETNISSNKPQSVAYYDRFGYQREQRVEGFDGKWIVTASAYDKLGHVTHQSVPNYDSASTYSSQQFYDALGRVYKQSKPTESGSVMVSSIIDGLDTTSIDEKGLKYKDTYSADGLLLTRVDPQSQVISYYYDAFGNTSKIVTKAKDKNNAWKNQVIITDFDLYGRKKAIIDPDKGNWSYTYNDFGELIAQTDAKNQTTTTDYDAMGRIVWRKDDTSLSCWGYGSNASLHNVGQPTWVKQWAGQTSCNTTAAVDASEIYSYDDYGRPVQTDFNIGGNSYSTRSEYNEKGQLSRQHYPSNNGSFYVNFYYNASHYLYLQRDSSNRDLRKIISMDALGNITNQTFANGTSETRGFNSRTGRINSIDLKNGNNFIHQLSYGQFDEKGNVEHRSHSYYNNSGLQTLGFSEDFTYDTLNRVYTRDLSVGSGSLNGYSYDEQYNYDGFGNLNSRKGYSGGSYSVNLASYDYLQTTSANRLNSATVAGKNYSKFEYDANGNIKSDGNRTFTYNAFDKASRIQAGTQYTEYRYNHERAVLSRTDYRQEGSDWKTFKTDYVGTIYQQERRFKGNVGAANLENTRHKYIIGNIMVVRNQNTKLGSSEEVQYQHADHQGSILTVTNKDGGVLEQYFYTVFGKPIKLSGSSIVQAMIPMERGYTGHEMLPNLDIIQMGGRLYDPSLARFMQADPFIQAPNNLQSYNRYSYVANNPLTYTDPSGYFFKNIGRFLDKYFDVIVAAFVTYATAGLASGWAVTWGFSGVAAGAASGAIAGAAGGYVATGSLRGAFMGSLSGAVFGAIGAQIHGAENTSNAWSFSEEVLAHGMAGGAMSSLQGGNFGHGFVSAGIMKGVGKIQTTASVGRVLVQSIAGGTVSRITGGKFANGAVTSAIQFIVNEVGNKTIYRTAQQQEEILKIQSLAVELAQNAANEVDSSDLVVVTLRRFSGDGPLKWTLYKMVRGQVIHTRFSLFVDAAGIPNFRGEGPSYLGGNISGWGRAFTSRPDASYGPIFKPDVAFELKTGVTPPSVFELKKYDVNLPAETELFIIQQAHGN
ncbi:toxin TcdB middle/N-terminal domain-containing protein [Shewanella sp. 1180_01]|uniref:toxin TcdB middle/N-terminal domain-containing protein n=1 Tax=Shewanella sp. 1180_01 TaxID=2604451 RepID=UPI0040642744